jgi:hypothetical protein
MRVIFEDEKAKGSLMANMKKLETTEDKFKQLSITHDMTKKERLQNREKLAEAKNKNDKLEENNPRQISAIFGINFCYPNYFITIFSILYSCHQFTQFVWQTVCICIKTLYAIKIHHLIYIGFC